MVLSVRRLNRKMLKEPDVLAPAMLEDGLGRPLAPASQPLSGPGRGSAAREEPAAPSPLLEDPGAGCTPSRDLKENSK
jgi:hypothetical protein